jgi:hypothetical protein
MSHEVYFVKEGSQPVGVEPIAFGSLAISERKHLEDWVIRNPRILGEQLLIITSEFDRFDKSSRRLDVLALDTSGVLVIVELKLDLAGSLADQQAIRYAAFCSTMTIRQVVEQFSRYHKLSETEATSQIRDFMAVDELPELGNKPRIILAAGSIDDPELTSCVLWLRSFGVDITCVELTPYRLPDRRDILVVPKVIIPLPETRDYVIGVEQKEVAQTQELKEKQGFTQFWTMVAEEFDRLDPPLQTSSIPRISYFQIRIGGKEIHYEWYLQRRKSQIGVAIHFESSYGEENLRWLAVIQEHAAEIQAGIATEFRAERWGRKWATAGFTVPYVGAPDRATARECANLMKKLIERTEHLLRPLILARRQAEPTPVPDGRKLTKANEFAPSKGAA